MKSAIVVLCTVVIVSMAFAGSPPSTTPANPGFDKLKALAGSWKGKDEAGNDVGVSFKLVSSGSSIMETLEMAKDPDAMVTMYHIDGSKLMMTHYCSMGNQPRMRADKLSADGSTLSFTMIDATNLPKKTDAHMSKLVVRFTDADHFIQEWSMSQDGKVAHVGKFEFSRVK